MDVSPDDVFSLLADAPPKEIALRILRELLIFNSGGTSRTLRTRDRPSDPSESAEAAPDEMRCAPTTLFIL